ncbi:SNF1-related protein kinase regulatory subunit gamma-1 [Prunus yedoensis var. nudiflora]|uniref:SNF1-related protein kinase regulatory subunit gamma-1 n=1 Tax=Prunus yedoensis var. nudiflora TaxID=2094558 RepID=A0A314ZGV8_PRUYE|nr:SNF1-related protein kinase regulatory subunit gamma-1 [Prunus yedoensis var. nudiflora]
MGVPATTTMGESESPRSPEAKLGMQVEDLWDVQEPQLSPTEKLNACFESVPVSAFPPAPSNQVIEISQTPVSLSLPGLLCGFCISQNLLLRRRRPVHRVQPRLPQQPNGLKGLDIAGLELGSDFAATTAGSFFEALTSSEFYKNTQVRDISGSFRWAPFLALQTSNSFLTMLLLLSKYKMKSVPVVDLGDGKIDNVITQSAVIHMLAECAGLQWFESWGTKKLSELGLPMMTADHIVKVYEDEPVLQAFKLMRKKRVGGVPVIEKGGSRAVEIYHDYRSITAKNFLTAVEKYLETHHEVYPMLSTMVTCKKDHTIKDLILMLDAEKIHRVYVVDDDGNLEGVITLRDIISRLVHEPRGYFGDFFDGVLPLPQNSRV